MIADGVPRGFDVTSRPGDVAVSWRRENRAATLDLLCIIGGSAVCFLLVLTIGVASGGSPQWVFFGLVSVVLGVTATTPGPFSLPPRARIHLTREVLWAASPRTERWLSTPTIEDFKVGIDGNGGLNLRAERRDGSVVVLTETLNCSEAGFLLEHLRRTLREVKS